MGYSSFVVENTGTSKYTELEIELYAVSLKSKDVYVINSKRQNNSKRQKIPSGKTVVMGDCIDIVVAGSEEEIKELAGRLKGPVGIVKYAGQNVGLVHSQAVVARDVAEEERKKYHFYQPSAD